MGGGDNPAPLSLKPIIFEMMDITEQIAKLYNTTPFDLLERDAEHVIMVINYVVMKAEDAPEKSDVNSKQSKKQKDSFWDF